ncbi:MAG TPA: hypothetical protein VEJ38_03780 [Candidatus Acidoferrales bacterium]|nr:hypothetical protein [Candidatus Acidoferrales bacterium]
MLPEIVARGKRFGPVGSRSLHHLHKRRQIEDEAWFLPWTIFIYTGKHLTRDGRWAR